MNRRNFFRRLALGVVSLPAVLKAASAPARPRYSGLLTENLIQSQAGALWRENPAWVSAPYEVHFAVLPDSFRRALPQRVANARAHAFIYEP